MLVLVGPAPSLPSRCLTALGGAIGRGGFVPQPRRARSRSRSQPSRWSCDGKIAEVQASRARIVQAGHLERRRLERNLHDGAQQRLLSVGLALRHVQHQLRSGSTEEVLSTLEAAVGEVSSTIQELRELARGLPPAALGDGFEPAFRELAARTSVPVEVGALTERLDQGLTTAAYFIGCKAHQRRQARRRQPDRAQRRAPQRALGGVRGR
jgi:signal transduction histidine kinase